MNRFSLLASAAAIAMLASAGVATAADLPPEGGMTYAPPAPAYGYSPWYLRGDAGIGFANGSGGEAFTAGMGVGYRLSEIFRADLTVDWTGDYNNRDAWTIMGNGYLDFAFGSLLRPYVGAGIGWGSVDRPGNDDDGFAFALHAGTVYNLGPQTDLDLSYRFRDISISGADFDDHSLRAGIRYSF